MTLREPGVIMMYLIDKVGGRFLPMELRRRYEVVRW
jgi:glutathione S-transferase